MPPGIGAIPFPGGVFCHEWTYFVFKKNTSGDGQSP